MAGSGGSNSIYTIVDTASSNSSIGIHTGGFTTNAASLPSGDMAVSNGVGSFSPAGLGFKIWIKISYGSGNDVLPIHFIDWIYPENEILPANEDSRYEDLTADFDEMTPYATQDLVNDEVRAPNVGASHGHVSAGTHSHTIYVSHYHSLPSAPTKQTTTYFPSSFTTDCAYGTGVYGVWSRTNNTHNATATISATATGISGSTSANDGLFGHSAKSTPVRLLRSVCTIVVEFPVGSYLWEHKDHPLDFDVMEGTWVVQVFSASYFMIRDVYDAFSPDGGISPHTHIVTNSTLLNHSHSGSGSTGVHSHTISGTAGECAGACCSSGSSGGGVQTSSGGVSSISASISSVDILIYSEGDGNYNANGFRVWKRVS
jgi:hypothetical protein